MAATRPTKRTRCARRSAEAERDALLAALDGRHIAAGPSGAPARGRTDVLPTGRNLFTADPRTMPTPTAFELGRAAADEVMRRYAQDHGDWPRALVIDLWGSASLRTGGEEIAQGLALMGCRPQWDAATGRVTGVEVLPPAALGRPRVDVTFRISGLFRDMFPAQIALIDAAVGAVAARDEADGDNPLAEALRANGKPPRRVFGSSPGTYGAGIEDLLASGKWEAREEIGRAFIDATSHAFGGADGDGEAAPGAFEERLSSAELLIHTGDDPGRDMLEGSADVAFIGGFAAALAALGRSADLIALDTTDPARPRARSLRRGYRPAWCAPAPSIRASSKARCGTARAAPPNSPRRSTGWSASPRPPNAVPGALIEAVHDAYLGDAEGARLHPAREPGRRPRHRRAAGRGAPARPLASPAQFGRRRSRGADRRGARPGDRGMNAPLPRGLCPTLAEPMQTGDGLLVRLNPVASGFSPKTLIGLCEAALGHGNGIVEVTARGNLQIRGLTARSARELVARRRCARHRRAHRRAGRDGAARRPRSRGDRRSDAARRAHSQGHRRCGARERGSARRCRSSSMAAGGLRWMR